MVELEYNLQILMKYWIDHLLIECEQMTMIQSSYTINPPYSDL